MKKRRFQKLRFNLFSQHIWRRFWTISIPYWQGEQKLRAWLLLFGLIALLLLETGLAVLLNNQTGEFTSALAERDADRFWTAITWCVVIGVSAAIAHAIYYFVRDTLANQWRRWLTFRLLGGYFGERRFYSLGSSEAIDNPDQRIAEDINTFTSRSLYFLLIFIGALMQLVAFSNVLWSLSHVLVYVLVLYAAAGTVLALAVFGVPLMRLNFLQLRREADFRFGLVRVRENAESIAFYRGEDQELTQVRGRFASAFSNYRRLIRKQLRLNVFQQAYGQITALLPIIIIAGDVLSGRFEVGQAIQAAGAFTAVMGAVSIIVDNFESLARFAAGIDRIDTLAHALLDAAPAPPANDDGTPRTITLQEGNALHMQGVSLYTPDFQRLLVRDLSLELGVGEGLMIVGASGQGKSSLLRAIAGLWRSGSGRIERPPPEDTLFLPQKPYMQIASLRSQLLYPHGDRDVPDEALHQALRDVHLPHLADAAGGLDAEADWAKRLSLGEQQRLAFARVLLSEPRFAILDEATSALDAGNEAALYERLRASGTTIISIAHRPSLLKYHTRVLQLTGQGAWQLHAARDFRFND